MAGVTKEESEKLHVMFPEMLNLSEFVSFYKGVCEELPSPKVSVYGNFSLMRENVRVLSNLEEGIHIKRLDLFTPDGRAPLLHLEPVIDYTYGDERPYTGVRDGDLRHYSEFNPAEIENAISVMRRVREISDKYFEEMMAQNLLEL